MKWPTTKLKDVALIQMGQSPPGHTYNDRGEGLPFFQGKVDFGDKHPRVRIWCSSPNRIAESGDVLLSVRAPVGPTNVADRQCCIGRGLAAIRSLAPAVILPDFIRYVFKWVEPELSRKGQGSTFTAINRKDVESIQFPLPPLSEQRRIVEILDQADALRKKRAEADAKAARILPALFYKMFGDPATNPRNWNIKSLSQVIRGKPQYGANASAVEWLEGMPRYVRITDITQDGRLSQSGVATLDLEDWEPYRLVPGDLLFARSGNTVGKTYLYRQEDGLCAYAGYLIRFQADPEQVTPWYLFSLTQTGYYKSWVEARKRVAGQPNINGKEYSSLQIPCPPLSRQQQFTTMVESLISSQNKRDASTERVDRLFNIILHRAFSGDVTAKWREAHMKELVKEMEQQAKALGIDDWRLPIEGKNQSSIIDHKSEIPHA